MLWSRLVASLIIVLTFIALLVAIDSQETSRPSPQVVRTIPTLIGEEKTSEDDGRGGYP